MGMNMPIPEQQLQAQAGLPSPISEPQPQQPDTGPSDIPHILQMNLQFTMIALLKQMQSVTTAQNMNMFEKMKSIPLLAQAVSSMHTAFHNTESLNFEKSKPDTSQVDAQIAKQDADHKYALDLMAQNHDEQIAQQKLELEKQKAEHDMQLKEMQAQLQVQSAQQDQQHKDDLHQSQLEQQEIQKAQTIQAAQQQEENHQQTMSITEKQAEADAKASKDKASKPDA